MYEELAIWRRENGFDRVAEGEESCSHGHRSLPPTPQEYYASLWCEVNTLKAAISMPAEGTATRPQQKDSLDELLANFEFPRIKEYVERRSREAARAQVTAVTRDDTVQHCSPCSHTPEPPSVVYFNLENEERIELEELKSSSAGTGLETPGQQCPPYEGRWEQGRSIANDILTAGVDSSKKGNISSPMKSVDTRASEKSTSTATVSGISSTAATPENRRLKTFSEENKQFDPGRRKEKAPPWKAAVALLDFSAESGDASCFCFVLCTCVTVFQIIDLSR